MNPKPIVLKPAKFLLSLGKAIVDFIYPPFCLACHAQLIKNEQLICNNCWNQLPQIPEDFDLLNEIRSKSGEEIYFSQAISVWEFSPAIQSAIHYLKYQNFKLLANRIGNFMAEKLNKRLLPESKTILIPVPLHKTRVRERGYNQSTLLCQVIAASTGLSYNDKILRRIRYTQSQTRLNAIERTNNVRDAFTVISAEKIKDKIIILIDDVITTGATMNACAKELMENGAETVYLLSAVRA